jgi:single-strand DNA-binding protein
LSIGKHKRVLNQRLVPRLTKNPEVKVLPSGTKVARFSIAVSRNYKNKNGNWQKETWFFDVECYGKLAERVAQLGKGYQVTIEGELRQDKWESASGEKRSKVKVVANKVNLVGKPKSVTVVKAKEEKEEEIAF